MELNQYDTEQRDPHPGEVIAKNVEENVYIVRPKFAEWLNENRNNDVPVVMIGSKIVYRGQHSSDCIRRKYS